MKNLLLIGSFLSIFVACGTKDSNSNTSHMESNNAVVQCEERTINAALDLNDLCIKGGSDKKLCKEATANQMTNTLPLCRGNQLDLNEEYKKCYSDEANNIVQLNNVYNSFVSSDLEKQEVRKDVVKAGIVTISICNELYGSK